jgi:hypothetical protein
LMVSKTILEFRVQSIETFSGRFDRRLIKADDRLIVFRGGSPTDREPGRL